MFRTRFRRDIVTEFLPSARAGKVQRAIILCDGMPSIPRKQPLAEFLAAKGYWVFYPRYRRAWESGGEFLKRSPHLDILDVIGGLSREFRELAFGRRFRVAVSEVFVIGGSFGGAAALLCSLDPRVKRVIANCRSSIGRFFHASSRKRLRILVTRLIFGRRLGTGTGCLPEIGRS